MDRRLGGDKSRRCAILRIVAGARIRPRLLERLPTPLPPVRKPQAQARGMWVALRPLHAAARAHPTYVYRRFRGRQTSRRCGPGRPDAPRAFADPLASRQEAPSASAGNAGSTPPAPHRCQSASNLRGLPASGAAKVSSLRAAAARRSSSVRRPLAYLLQGAISPLHQRQMRASPSTSESRAVLASVVGWPGWQGRRLSCPCGPSWRFGLSVVSWRSRLHAVRSGVNGDRSIRTPAAGMFLRARLPGRRGFPGCSGDSPPARSWRPTSGSRW